MTGRPPRRLWVVRHGETDWNAEGRLQGQRDTPLNGRGRAQADAVGRALRDRGCGRATFVASPLSRARETMERLRAAMDLDPGAYLVDDRLMEISFGVWEGRTWREVKAQDPAAVRRRAADRWGHAPPGGESYATLASRVGAAVDAIDADAVVVTHGGVMRTMMVTLAGRPPIEAVGADVAQGRALLFEAGGCVWL